jgi:hypothetical protein
MSGTNGPTVASEARVIFDRIKESLEASHANQFVAIEPSSGEWFRSREFTPEPGQTIDLGEVVIAKPPS